MKKSEFKNLLKESIRELINEGAFTKPLQEALSKQQPTQVVSEVSAFDVIREATKTRNGLSQLTEEQRNLIRERFSAPDDLIRQPSSAVPPGQLNTHMKNLVKSAASEMAKGNAGQSALMEEIFADTVATTMVHQRGDMGHLAAYLPEETPMSEQQLMQEQQVLDVLAGQGGSSRWAAVAGVKKNK